jgi:uncharacterized cupin superfamily protein
MPKIEVSAQPIKTGSAYPAPFDEPVRTRAWQKLGDAAGLTQFGVNLVRMPPGSWSSQRHWHEKEDELVWVVEGEVVMVTDAGEETLRAGDCAGFAAGVPDGHHFQNRSAADVVLLVVGSRVAGDSGTYSDIDMTFGKNPSPGAPRYHHKDGRPY